MKLSKLVESLVESVDGEGNQHWKRDAIVIAAALSAAAAFVIYGLIETL